jgi:hypothetical protein
MDLVPKTEGLLVEQWRPSSLPTTDEGTFLGIVGGTFLQVGAFGESWTDSLIKRLRATAFNKSAKKADGALGKDGAGALGPPQ